MGTWKEIFGIDLDTKDAAQKLDGLNKSIAELGGKDSLSGLISGLSKVTGVAALVGGAFLSAKKALDWTMEGEQLRSIDKQFELLGNQAGIATKKLSDGLKTAAAGLIDDTDLIKEANKAIIAMGKGAEKLPQILELAKKAAAVSGESVSEAFGKLNAAISSGQTRALKAMGITVDSEKAYLKYAQSIGVAVGALSEAGRKQAVLNEVLAVGNKNLGAVDTSIVEATNTWTALKVTVGQIGETFVRAFEKTAGPVVKSFLKDLQYVAGKVSETFNAQFGEGPQQLEAQIGKLKERIGDVTENITKMEQGKNSFWNKVLGDPEVYIARSKEHLKNLDAELVAMQAKLKKEQESSIAAPTATGGDGDRDLVNAEKKKTIESQLAKDLIAIQGQVLQAKLANYQTEDQFEELRRMRLDQLEQERQAKVGELSARALQENLNLNDQIAAQNELYKQKKLQLEQQLSDELVDLQVTTLTRQGKAQTDAWSKFATGAKLASANAKKSLNDFTAFGTSSVNTMADAFGQAFVEVGQGGISLGNALKKSMIGAVADIAAAKGKELIASSIFPPNPVGIAAGAGLLALSGVLRSAVGAPAAISSSAEGGGGGGSEAPRPVAESSPEAPTADQFTQQQRKAVTINIQGSYFDSDETRRRLTQMIRDEADASDFKILSVGGGV